MTNELFVFEDPPLDGASNMARDEHLLYSPSLRPAAVRIYGWEPPTISLGYFQHICALEKLPGELRELAVVRRPTGGGAILHDREITYCLVLHEPHPAARQSPVELYRLVHGCWQRALQADGLFTELAPDEYPLPTPRGGPFFCFERAGRTDLLLSGRKLLGSAQRRIAGRVLQHGSLLLARRFRAHPGADLGGPAPELARRWTRRFVEELSAALSLTPRNAQWTAVQLADVEQRRRRYASQEWLRRF